MCKHILNAQVSIRAPCCKKWFDCPECHEEHWAGKEGEHELMKIMEFVFACKKCKKAFRKAVEEFEEADEYCPHCDNHFIIEAKTPETEGKLVVQVEQMKGHENRMFVDDREKRRAPTLQEETKFTSSRSAMMADISDSELDEL